MIRDYPGKDIEGLLQNEDEAKIALKEGTFSRIHARVKNKNTNKKEKKYYCSPFSVQASLQSLQISFKIAHTPYNLGLMVSLKHLIL